MQGVNRIPSPDGHAQPPGDYETWDAYMADVETLEIGGAAQRRADYEANAHLSHRISKAMCLAPNAIVFKALLEGQPVPHDALDQRWLRRYA